MTEETIPMKAIVVMDQAAGTAGMTLVERPEPQAAINDVVVQVHASGFVPTELAWPSTVTERRRSLGTSWPEWSPPSAMARGGCRWDSGCSASRTGLATAPWRSTRPSRHATSGLTAWQGLFEHGRLQAGQSVLVHGAAGAVGSMVTQLAREAGAYVIGTGRPAHRQTALDFGAQEFVDLGNDALEDVGGVDLVFDVIGGAIQNRST